jgi:ferredoxin
MNDIYEQLALHLSTLGMGLPYRDDLLTILKNELSSTEAGVLLLLPTKVAPLQLAPAADLADNNLPAAELAKMLESLTQRGWLFSGITSQGEKGYALHQMGFGFPQSFFWKGVDTPYAKNMAKLVAKYLNRGVITESYASSQTKPFRFIPVAKSIDHKLQTVFPYHMMENVIEQAKVFAVAHCPCRVTLQLLGKPCQHPLEVCIKFDDMAEYIIKRELGREITRVEALKIVQQSEESGLVHFVDNATKDIKHNCNCCGCACWSVGSIRKRKIPRDILMATYFIKETDRDKCLGCGSCIDICPVNAITIKDGYAVIDEDWCIGCGLCVPQCPNEAARLKLRTDNMAQSPEPNFRELYHKILKEKGLI